MLEVRDLSVGYRKSAVLSEVSLDVPTGGAIGLIGRNGSGKSCLAQTLIGTLPPLAGSILWNGADITSVGSRRRIAHGLSIVPEGRMIFNQLTVRENLRAAAYGAAKRLSSRDVKDAIDRFPELEPHLDRRGGALSGGQQQMLAIARAVVQRPALVILDEPTLGLAPVTVSRMITALKGLRDSGVSLVLMEQNRRVLQELSDIVHPIHAKRLATAVAASDLTDQIAVRAQIGGDERHVDA